MNGLKMTRKQALAASAKPPEKGDFVWDGIDENDRPLSKDEMLKGMPNIGGRPKSFNPKVSIRYDADVIEYFKATGKGWQTRMNEVLSEYVKSH